MTQKNLRPELLVQVLILVFLIPAIMVVGRPGNETNTASSSLAIYSNNQNQKSGVSGEDEEPKFQAEGPGGPILVITSAANPFSKYLSEILRAEGLNEFAVRDISAISSPVIENYDV
ncbi:MAG TPA: hypothetical protein VFI06_14590, partial [Chitinophagaceae bacterium]|nr:hypothetical protein [Chitinophagaceae bacterium]